MTQYRTQWDDAPIEDIGGAPPGWTLHDAAYASVERGSPWAPASALPFRTPVKSRMLRVHPGDASDFRCVSWDRLDADPARVDIELLPLLMPAEDDPIWHVYARGQGTTPTDFYRVAIDRAAGEIRLEKYTAATLTEIDSAAVTIAAGVAHWVRFRVDGTAIQATVWPVGEAEPAAWQVDAVDSDISAAGWASLGGQTGGVNQFAEFNIVAAATGGETARRPMTDAEWMEWAGRQDVLRAVCVKLNAIAFAPCAPGFTKTVPVYISDTDYTSKPWDEPANVGFIQCLDKAPTVTREISQALAGVAKTSVGAVVVTNPGGIRSHWLDWLWAKDGVEVLMGDPAWPLADFRALVVGCLAQQPVGGDGRITFNLADRSGILDAPFTTATIGGSGDQANAFMPEVIGSPVYADVDVYDAAGLVYQVASALDSATPSHEVYDRGNLLKTTGTMLSADAGTDVITTSANHGMVVGYTFIWDVGGGGTPPSPMVEGVEYFAQAIPGLAQVKLSETPGGAAINLTDAGSGNPSWTAYGWQLQASSGRIKLAANPADQRVIMRALSSNFIGNAGFAVKAVLLDRGILSTRDFAFGFDNIGVGIDSGLRVAAEPATMGSVVDRAISGVSGWHGWTPDGLLEGGRVDLPDPDDVVMEFSREEVVSATLAWKVPPIRREALELRFKQRNYTRGIPQYATNADIFGQAYTVADRLAALTPGTPLESFVVEPRKENVFTTTITDDAHAAAECDRLAELYGRELGAYRFVFRNMRAALLPKGRTVRIDWPALDWRTWSAEDPVSPDNPGDIDATLGVVLLVKPDPVARTVEVLAVRRTVKRWSTFRADLPPATFSADLLTSVVPEIGNGAPSFTRASTRSFTDYLGAGGTAGAGEVAFEGARRETPGAANIRNHILDSQDIGAWTLSEATVTRNAGADSDGVVTLDKIVESTNNALHYAQRLVTTLADDELHDVVIELAAAGRGFALIELRTKTPAFHGVMVDLSAGTAAALGAPYSAPVSVDTEQRGGGRTRVTVRLDSGAGGSTPYVTVYTSSGATLGDATYLGDGSSGVLAGLVAVKPVSVPAVGYQPVGNAYPFYGAMVDEVEYHATGPSGEAVSWSLLKGVVISDVDAADVLTYPVPGNIPAHDFAIVFEWTPTDTSTALLFSSFQDANNNVTIYYYLGLLRAAKVVGGVLHEATLDHAPSAGVTVRVAARFSSTRGLDLFVGGVKGVNAPNTDAPVFAPTWQVGGNGVGFVAGTNMFRRMAVVPGDLNDEQMTDLST